MRRLLGADQMAIPAKWYWQGVPRTSSHEKTKPADHKERRKHKRKLQRAARKRK